MKKAYITPQTLIVRHTPLLLAASGPGANDQQDPQKGNSMDFDFEEAPEYE
ncbi:MAG: hypothetical protein J5914_00655 [Prevotella sp.]|nr:hypothetical protein [Prevotella sp.]